MREIRLLICRRGKVATFSRTTLDDFLIQVNSSTTAQDKGKALEDLIIYIFDKVPGITDYVRNQFHASGAEEIDVLFVNNKSNPKGFYFLPEFFLVECKNWSNSVGSRDVSWFKDKIEERGYGFGIIVAANGITGDATDLTHAHQIVFRALSRGIRIVVLEINELENLESTEELVELIKKKIMKLLTMGRF